MIYYQRFATPVCLVAQAIRQAVAKPAYKEVGFQNKCRVF